MKNLKASSVFLSLMLVFLLLLTACGTAEIPAQENEGDQDMVKYVSITQDEAKTLMDSDDSIVILDVRSQEEYDEGHIENAILIPHDEISDRAEDELPDKNQTILVYCRSGNRSKVASKALAGLGYTDIREFGGINTWEYEIVK